MITSVARRFRKYHPIQSCNSMTVHMYRYDNTFVASTARLKSCNFHLQFLQNLGKVDRTADDIFDEHLQNFTRQQNSANRLQKEFNNYIRCVRGESSSHVRLKLACPPCPVRLSFKWRNRDIY